MRTARKCGDAGTYHVVSRGVGQQIIFETEADRRRYLDSLRSLLQERSGHLLAWCLMDNHVHLLVQQPIEELSDTMRRLNSGYALYFNRVHSRNGHLFQGRFLSEPVDSDEYLMTVVRYIHQNPKKAGIAHDCLYEWSSYASYYEREVPDEMEFVLDVFGGVENFRSFHEQDAMGEPCIDATSLRGGIDDEQALAVALSLFGDNGLGGIKSLPRPERNAALAALKAKRLTIRQIQRLTGVSLGTISQA